MKKHLAVLVAALLVSTHAHAGSRLNQLPDVDPEVQQPGMEVPHSMAPRPTTAPKKVAVPPRVLPLPKDAVIAPTPAPASPPPAPPAPALPKVAQPSAPPVVVPGMTIRRYGPPQGVPTIPVRVEPSPQEIIGLFVGAVLTIIQAAQSRR